MAPRNPGPRPCQLDPAIKWKEVAVGQNLTVALSKEGQLYACGDNSYGQLGTGATNLNSNVLVPVAGGYRWRAMAAGDFHVVAIRDDGTLWSWGQLYQDAGNGFGTMTNRLTPVQVGTATNWLTVIGGFQHSLALDTQCNAWAWGYNAFGELGLGTQLPQVSPTPIASGTSWISVRASGLNHIGIRADGTLWNWSGASGQYAGDTSGL